MPQSIPRVLTQEHVLRAGGPGGGIDHLRPADRLRTRPPGQVATHGRRSSARLAVRHWPHPRPERSDGGEARGRQLRPAEARLHRVRKGEEVEGEKAAQGWTGRSRLIVARLRHARSGTAARVQEVRHRKALAETSGAIRRAIEFKHQNVSGVWWNSLPYIEG